MLKKISLVICLLTLQSCSLPQAISYNVSHSLGESAPQRAPSIVKETRKIGKPYNIPNEHGQPILYTPLQNSDGYREFGVASWYGKDFHAKKTANGEDYNMYSYTAAHKTLPLPTYVRVTNTNNGKSIIVRVNDRGPFYKNRLIDMSYAGAKALGFDRQGTAPVLVEAISIYGGDVKRNPYSQYANKPYSPEYNLKPAPRPTSNGYNLTSNRNNISSVPVNSSSFTNRIVNRNKAINQSTNATGSSPAMAKAASSNYFIQLGSFTDINNARQLYYKAKRSINNVKITSLNINSRTYYRVIVDKINNVEQATNILNDVKTYGFNEAIVSTQN